MPPPPTLLRFVFSSIGHLFRGPLTYWLWVLLLLSLIALGGWHYYLQLRDGLVVTNGGASNPEDHHNRLSTRTQIP